MKWTEEQSRAIESRGYALSVSAGAGSGKTAVMIERIVQMVLRGEFELSDFAAMTFTRAAAGEMKSRIQRALLTANTPRARAQLDLLDEAYFGTIHGFCSAVIRRFHEAAEVDPDFAQADDGLMQALKSEVVREVIDGFYEAGTPEFLAFAAAWDDVSNEALPALITSLYERVRMLPDYMQALRRNAAQFRLDDAALAQSLWGQALKTDALRLIHLAQNGLAYMRSLCALEGMPAELHGLVEEDEATLDALRAYVQADGAAQGLPAPEVKLRNMVNKKKLADPSMQARAAAARDVFKGYVKALLESPVCTPGHPAYGNTRRMAGQMDTLVDVLEAFDLAYAREKELRGVLDYGDLEHKALRVLRDDACRAALRERYRQIFVDEFQDMSPMQAELLSYLEEGGSFFCVGDVKQSIYRFRGAAPHIFIARLRESVEEERIFLNRNFRSNPKIIDYINDLFENIMDITIADIQYDENEALRSGIEAWPEAAPVELHIIDEAQNETPAEEGFEELEAIGREARLAAGRIRELLGQTIRDRGTGELRPLRPGDIAILVRSTRTTLRHYAQALQREGLPVLAVSNETLAQEPEVGQMLSLLRVIDNAMEDDALLEALYSPICGLTMEELAQVRVGRAGIPFGQAAAAYAQEADTPAAEKLRGFFTNLETWRLMAQNMEPDRFVMRLAELSGFYDYVGAMPEGDHRQANLRALSAAGRGYRDGFSSFARRAPALLERVETVSIIGGAGDSVRIMTMHKSKGLEFPVVLVCGLGKAFNTQESREALVFHQRLGLGPRFRDGARRVHGDTLARMAAVKANRAEDIAEEMRLLYVALTRAMDRLVLIGSVKSLEKRRADNLARGLTAGAGGASSHLDWLLARAMETGAMPDVQSEDISPGLMEPRKADVFVHTAGDIMLRYGRRRDDGDLAKAFYRLLEETPESPRLIHMAAWEYPYQDTVGLPAKISATALLERGRDWRRIPAPARRERETPRRNYTFSAMERGTHTHTLLQHLPIGMDDSGAILALAQSLEERRLLPPGAAAELDMHAVLLYTRSAIAARIAQSPLVKKEEPFILSVEARALFPGEQSREHVLVQGIIDCCFIEDGQWVLVDYKTNYVDEVHTPQSLAAYYTPQLRIYKRALEQITNMPVKETCLYLISAGIEQSVEL